MKSFKDGNGNWVGGCSILEACLSHPRKRQNLIKTLTKLNMTIDPSVQISDKGRKWIR